VTLVVRPPIHYPIRSTIDATESISKDLQSVNGLHSDRHCEVALVGNHAPLQ
jgi:hypothetical protein